MLLGLRDPYCENVVSTDINDGQTEYGYPDNLLWATKRWINKDKLYVKGVFLYKFNTWLKRLNRYRKFKI